jgi:hypothetical protein
MKKSWWVSTPAGVCALLIGLSTAGTAQAVPSFARQTGMACQSCHTVFPELTPFGRSFKLNAYTIDNLPQVQGMTSTKEMELLLNQIPPLSIMFQTSFTQTKQTVPDSAIAGADGQNGQVLFPQQLSLFYAGRIAPNLGTFIQLTYDSQSGSIGLDNTEFRYAKLVPSVPEGLIYGFTLNNNPTVQDVWNSTPAWQTPFDQRTSAAPSPAAVTQIDGGLTDRGVAGLTAYMWWRNSIYAEVGFYRSSPKPFTPSGTTGVPNGNAGPLDSTAGGVLSGYAPYWRVAYEHQWGRNSWSGGAYGIQTKISPADQQVGSFTDQFRDVALDSQYQYIGDEHILSAQTTYIQEKQKLGGTFALGEAENENNHLNTFRAGGSYYYQRTYGGALGYFSTKGSSDALLYAPGMVTGFANSSPNSSGWIGEIAYVPWQNVKFTAQYVAYQKFNGASKDYDGNGRNANYNNTLYLLGWFAF